MLAPLSRSSQATAIYCATDCDRFVKLNTNQIILPATDISSHTPNHSFGLAVENRLYRDVVIPKPPRQVEDTTVTNASGGHPPDPSDSWTIVTHSRKTRRPKEFHGPKHFAYSSSTRVARTTAPSMHRPSLLPFLDEKSWPKLQVTSNKVTSAPDSESVYSPSKSSLSETNAPVALSEGGTRTSPKKSRAIPPPLRISPEMRRLPSVVAVSSAWDVRASQPPITPLSWPPRLFQLHNASESKPHKERGVSLFDPGIIQEDAFLPDVPRTWQKYSEYTFDAPNSSPSSPSSFSIDFTCDSDEESSAPIPPVEYDGRPDEDAFNRFVAEGMSWVDEAQISESQQVHAIARFLTGAAYHFFARNRRHVEWTLAAFFEALFQHIFQSHRQESMLDIFQGHDTVTTYVQKLQTLLFLSNIRGERSSRRERVNCLWRGFRREIQESLWNAQYNPDVALWSEIVKYADAFEMAERITGQDSASWERRRRSVRSDETDSEADYPRRLRTSSFRPFDDDSTT